MKKYEICIAPERECPAGRAGFEIDVLVIDLEPPPPIPDRAFRCVSRVGLGIFYVSTLYSVVLDAIDRES